MTSMVQPSQTVTKRIGALVFALGLAAAIMSTASCSRLGTARSAKSTATATPVAIAIASPTATSIPTTTPIPTAPGFLYAKEVTSDRDFRIYELFLTDTQGANPRRLFRIVGGSTSGSGLIRQWGLLSGEKAILVNLGRLLMRYDLKTGQPTLVYTVEEERWRISGFALSHNERSIALTLVNIEDYFTSDRLLVILDYEGGMGRVAVAAKVPAPFTYREGWPVAGVWSPDDQLIYFQGVYPRDVSPPYLWASSRDGSDLHPLPVQTGGILSLDGRWYAYTDGQLPPWPGLYNPCSVIGLLDLASGTTSTVVQQENPDLWFILRAWSPDSRQLLYSSRPSSAPTLPIAQEYQEDVSYLYDLSTGSRRQVASWREQKRTWLDLVPVCARRLDIVESVEAFPYCEGELLIQGQVVDSGRLIYIGRLPALE